MKRTTISSKVFIACRFVAMGWLSRQALKHDPFAWCKDAMCGEGIGGA